MKESSVGRLSLPAKIILILMPVVASFISITVGRYNIPLDSVFKAIISTITDMTPANPQISVVIWTIRMPRILLALLVGAGLSSAGTAFQSLFSNPLATPDTLGVASGASFGAALGFLFGFSLIGVQLMALAAGMAAVILTYAVSREKGSSINTIVLAGIIIGSLFSALVSLVKYTADPESQLPSITYWLMGSFSSASYGSLILGAPFILLGIAVLYAIRWKLNLLPLSDDEARASGTDIRLLRLITVICATMITASCVAMCGQVGWVGLLIPHICRMKFGSNNLKLMPASISTGATFMLIIDMIARGATASEIPVSILTALIGAPFFIALMRRSGGWSL